MANDLAYTVKPLPDAGEVVLDFAVEHIDEVSDANIGSVTPATGLAGRLPFVQAFHWDGDSDRFGGTAVVDVGVFAGKYKDASRIGRDLEAALLGYPYRVDSGGVSVLVDSVQVLTSMREVEWQEGSTIRRFLGTYQFSYRR